MTCRIWSRSRMRRGSGNPRTLLSICGVLVFSAKLSVSVALASLAFSFSGGIIPNFVANASSTCSASAADNWFFATSRRCAHSAASSVELRPSISRSNSTRQLAERAIESSRWSEADADLFPAPRPAGRSDPTCWAPLPRDLLLIFSCPVSGTGSVRSGASRSSSPAMPTSVNKE
jgi:hypothetical protein